MARPGDKNYRHPENKDLQSYYQRAGRKQRLPVQRSLAFLLAIIIRLLGTRIIGRENIPKHGAMIIAPNHYSYFDPLFFAFLARRRAIRAVGKSQLFTGWLGPILVAVGAFPIRRGHYDQQAFALCRKFIDQGQALLLFPQGGIHHQLDRDSARWGVGLVAQQNPVPVIPVFIAHRRLFANRLIIGPALYFPDNKHPERPDNQLVAEKILAAISALQPGKSAVDDKS